MDRLLFVNLTRQKMMHAWCCNSSLRNKVKGVVVNYASCSLSENLI